MIFFPVDRTRMKITAGKKKGREEKGLLPDESDWGSSFSSRSLISCSLRSSSFLPSAEVGRDGELLDDGRRTEVDNKGRGNENNGCEMLQSPDDDDDDNRGKNCCCWLWKRSWWKRKKREIPLVLLFPLFWVFYSCSLLCCLFFFSLPLVLRYGRAKDDDYGTAA